MTTDSHPSPDGKIETKPLLRKKVIGITGLCISRLSLICLIMLWIYFTFIVILSNQEKIRISAWSTTPFFIYTALLIAFIFIGEAIMAFAFMKYGCPAKKRTLAVHHFLFAVSGFFTGLMLLKFGLLLFLMFFR